MWRGERKRGGRGEEDRKKMSKKGGGQSRMKWEDQGKRYREDGQWGEERGKGERGRKKKIGVEKRN